MHDPAWFELRCSPAWRPSPSIANATGMSTSQHRRSGPGAGAPSEALGGAHSTRGPNVLNTVSVATHSALITVELSEVVEDCRAEIMLRLLATCKSRDSSSDIAMFGMSSPHWPG